MLKKNHFIFSYLQLLFFLYASVTSICLSATQQSLDLILSQNNFVDEYSRETYIYLNQDLIDIINEILEFNAMADESSELLFEFAKHVENGYCIARYHAVLEILDAAKTILQSHSTKLESDKFENITTKFTSVIHQVTSGLLTVNEKFQATMDMTTRAPLKTHAIDKNIIIKGKSTFNRHVKTKEDAHIHGKLKVNKTAQFKENVKINGTLSVTEQTVSSLSVTDATIQNLTLTGTLLFTNLLDNNDISINSDIGIKNENEQAETVYQISPLFLLNEIKKQYLIIEELKQNTHKQDLIIQSLVARINMLETYV